MGKGIVAIPDEDMKDLLKTLIESNPPDPQFEDAKIVRIDYDYKIDSFIFLLEGENFKELPAGAVVPGVRLRLKIDPEVIKRTFNLFKEEI